MRVFTAIFIFLFVLLLHSRSVMIVSTDSMWSIYLAKSFIQQGDLVLDEYKDLAKKRKKYGLRIRKGELYSYFPVGTALMAVPFVWLYEKSPATIASVFPGFKDASRKVLDRAEDAHLPLQRLIASIFVAATSVLIFYLCLFIIPVHQNGRDLLALMLSLLAAFATPLWSTASRGLWQHGPSALLICLAILLLINIKKYPTFAGFLGLCLAYAYVVRPTNAGIFLIALVLMCFQGRRSFMLYCLGASIVFIPFVAYSYAYLGKLIPPYYSASRVQIGAHFPNALLANLFSPNRGLLLMSPFLLIGFLQLLKVLISLSRQFFSFATPLKTFFNQNQVDIFVVGGFVAHLLSVSLFPEWWGGHAFGARYMTETTPYLIYFLARALSEVRLSRAAICSFVLLSSLSVFVHYKGANSFDVFNWNTRPSNIDSNPNRAWDIFDLQFLR